MKHPISAFILIALVALIPSTVRGQDTTKAVAVDFVQTPYKESFTFASKDKLLSGKLTIVVSDTLVQGRITYNREARKAGYINRGFRGRAHTIWLSTDSPLGPCRSKSKIRFQVRSFGNFRGTFLRTADFFTIYHFRSVLKGRFSKPALVFSDKSLHTFKKFETRSLPYVASRPHQ